MSAVTDIALEVKYLSVLDHPNIIKIRGMASSDPCAKDFLFLLDRLFETLNDRIMAWRNFLHKLSGGFERFFHLKRGQKEREKHQHLADRLCVAEEICCALEYLHSKRYEAILILFAINLFDNHLIYVQPLLICSLHSFRIIFRDLVRQSYKILQYLKIHHCYICVSLSENWNGNRNRKI